MDYLRLGVDFGTIWMTNSIASQEYFAQLLQSIFLFACYKQTCRSDILIVSICGPVSGKMRNGTHRELKIAHPVKQMKS